MLRRCNCKMGLLTFGFFSFFETATAVVSFYFIRKAERHLDCLCKIFFFKWLLSTLRDLTFVSQKGHFLLLLKKLLVRASWLPFSLLLSSSSELAVSGINTINIWIIFKDQMNVNRLTDAILLQQPCKPFFFLLHFFLKNAENPAVFSQASLAKLLVLAVLLCCCNCCLFILPLRHKE